MLEAMKMQSTVYAPVAGKVTQKLAQPGPDGGCEGTAAGDRIIYSARRSIWTCMQSDITPRNFR